MVIVNIWALALGRSAVKLSINRCSASVLKKPVHVVVEVGVPHERRPSVLRKVAAHSGGVSRGSRIEHDAELVVVDVVGVAADLAEVVLHVDFEFELGHDDGNQRALRDVAFLGREPS